MQKKSRLTNKKIKKSSLFSTSSVNSHLKSKPSKEGTSCDGQKSEKNNGGQLKSQNLEGQKDWKKEYKSLENKYQYLMAEYANYRKQTTQQIADLKKYDGQFFIEDFINHVMDDFDQAMKWELTQKTVQDFKTGMEMIYNRFKKILKDSGVREQESQGKAFDPACHSAVSSTPSDEVPPDHILRVLKKVYRFHDKLIRPGLVIVASQPKKKK